MGEKDLKRILVARIGALGDTLMATPVVGHIKNAYPEARVDFLCSASAAPLLESNPLVSHIWRLRHRNLPFFLSPEKIRMSREIQRRNYDWAVLLEAAPRYRYLLERSGIREIRSFRENPFDPDRHAILNNLAAAGIAGFACPEEGHEPDMDLFTTPGARQRAERMLEGLPSPRVGIHAGYGPRGRKKDQSRKLKGWALSNFKRLAGLLAKGGNGLVLTGSSDDRTDSLEIEAGLRPDQVRSLAGKTSLQELAAVIEQLDLFISVDSGPAHMAAALGTPLVVLWGPGIPQQTRPVTSRSPVRIIRHPVPCSPCYGTPLQKSCRRNVCMEGIQVEEVLAEALKFLSSRQPAAG